jgi:hypothetical protein
MPFPQGFVSSLEERKNRSIWIDAEAGFQTLFKSDGFEVQVILHSMQLLVETYQFAFRADQRAAQMLDS